MRNIACAHVVYLNVIRSRRIRWAGVVALISSSSINLSCERFIASSKVLERDCPGKVIMW
jgi:hypothetical protein